MPAAGAHRGRLPRRMVLPTAVAVLGLGSGRGGTGGAGMGKIKLRQLEILLALAEERHFGRAAERLGMAQPALSQQLRILEDSLGVTLFDRTNRSVQLNAAGRALLPAARRTISAAEQTETEARRFVRGEVGQIDVSFSASIAYSGVLQDAIGGFRRAFPDVLLNIREMLLSEQIEALREGRADLGFVRPPVPEVHGLELHLLAEEQIILLMPEGHRLAGEGPVDLADCQTEGFIIPDQDAAVSFHRLTRALCAGAGFEPRIVRRARDWITIASLVALGMGVAFAPASFARVRLPGLLFRELSDQPLRAPIALALRPGDRTPVVESFLGLVLPHFAARPPA